MPLYQTAQLFLSLDWDMTLEMCVYALAFCESSFINSMAPQMACVYTQIQVLTTIFLLWVYLVCSSVMQVVVNALLFNIFLSL